jgi:outer membrane protein assembly factor BamD
MRFGSFVVYVLMFSFSFLISCSGYEKAKRSNDVNYKLTMANQYFDKKDFLHAREMYESLMPVMKGTKNFEPMYYKYALSCFQLKDYNSASYHFKNYSSSFPNSANSDEANFLHAFAIYKMSPKITVMQSNTEKALEVLQTFVNSHPDSKHLEEANKYIVLLQSKLEEKAAIAAKLYYDINQFRAATVVYKNLQTDFPLSTKMDEYQYMIVKANYKFAKASVKEKQEERFVNVLSAYQELVDTYPKSKFIKDAEKYFSLSSSNIKKIKNEHK